MALMNALIQSANSGAEHYRVFHEQAVAPVELGEYAVQPRCELNIGAVLYRQDEIIV